MMIKIYLASVFCFFLSCFSWSGLESQETKTILQTIRVNEKRIIGDTSNEWILNAQDIVCLPNNVLVVSDKLDYKLKKYDIHNKIIAEIGKRGKDRGEFRGPGPLSASKKIIAVADFASPRVQIFSLNLEYISTFWAPGPIFALCFDHEENLWLGLLSGREQQNLYKVNPRGEVLLSIRLKNTSPREFDQLFSFVISEAGYIIIAYSYQNKIEIWDIRGNFKNEFEIPGIPSHPKKKIISQGFLAKDLEIPEDNIFRSVAVDNANIIYVLADEYTMNPGRDIFVVDSKGHLNSIFTLPNRSSRLRMGPHNTLYSIEKNRTLIKVYELEQEKNDAPRRNAQRTR